MSGAGCRVGVGEGTNVENVVPRSIVPNDCHAKPISSFLFQRGSQNQEKMEVPRSCFKMFL